MKLEEFLAALHEVLVEAFIEDDPSVGLVSPFDGFYRTEFGTWVLTGEEDLVITVSSIGGATSSLWGQAKVEGMQEAIEGEQWRIEGLLDTIDSLQAKIDQLEDE